MKRFSYKFFLQLCCIVTLLLSATVSKATHIIGADLYYTYVSGNTYTVTLVLYGDCSGSAFPLLQSSQPQIALYNNTATTPSQTITLVNQSGSGTEVTPVCPSEVNNTTCVSPSGTVPGIKRFIYTGNITINTTSTNWRFRFDGNLGPTSSAGRSGLIGNIVGASGSIMALEATLNNTITPLNSSPILSTIPTPFFCVNKPANYNPGAIDPNGDALTFTLIPALEAGGGNVTYNAGYSGTNPLSVVPGTFSINSSNGQIAFTPDIQQVSDVVNRISEYRGGVLVGTSMREMNFVVRNCNNNPPGGVISSTTGGTVLDTTTVTVCASAGLFSFGMTISDPDANNINVTWAGIPSGAIMNVFGNGTNAPIATFTWNVTNVTPGTYTIYVTYIDDGCPLASKQTIAYTITVLPKPAFTFVLNSPATCTKKAVFTITPSVGPTPWIVKVVQGGTTYVNTTTTNPVIDSLNPGTYTILVTNGNGCQKDSTVTIAPPPPVTVSATATPPVCNGGTNGSITITGGGGLTPFVYAQGAGAYSGTNTFTNLTAGTYTFHVKDANNCIKDTTITLTDPPAILANVTTTKPPCNHFQNGSITVAAYNSTAPYTYALGAGAYGASGTFSGLFSGTYTVHIKNSVGCIKDMVVVLPDSVKIAGTAAISPILCNGNSTGSVTISASGAFPPYTYAVGSGSFGGSNTFPNLPAGTYTFHVRDTEQCYFDTTLTITQPPVVTISATGTNVLCNGASTGTITAAGGGGTPGYTYALGAGGYSGSGSFTNLAAGTYTVHAKDANGCIKDTVLTLTQPTAIIPAVSFTKPLCVGSADGTVTITGSGGTPGYTYAIGAGAYSATNTFTGLAAGTYTLHIKDNNGCIKDSSFTMVNPPAIVPAVTLTTPTCTGGTNGSITIAGSGGAPGYTYALGAGAYGASGSFTGLIPGTYTLHVKDANNCIKDTTVTLTDAPEIHATVTFTQPPCNHFSNGSITIAAFNSVSPYQYALGAGAYGASGSFTGLFSGNYTIHIKNALGCIKDTLVVLPDSVKIAGAATVTNILCNGDTTGGVTINASGAFPPYTFAVGSGTFGSSNVFNPLSAGTYTFHVLDTRQCYFDTTITLTQPTRIIPALVLTNVTCNAGNNGAATVSATGGVNPYTYALGAGAYSGTTVYGTLTAGTYTIHVKDNNNCIKDTSFSITQPAAVTVVVVTDTPSCNGSANGTFTVTGGGGTGTYTYAIGAGAYSATNVFSGLTAGTYTLHVKDANGCIKDTTVTLVQPTAVTVTATAKKSTCSTLGNGKVTLTGGGGTAPYQYANGAGSYGASNVFSPLAAGTYTFHVKDNKGCIKDTTITITDSLTISGTVAVTNATCYNVAGGSFTVTPAGGTNPYTFAVGAGSYGSSATFSSLLAGTYVLHIKDSNGCIKDTNIAVTQPTSIVPSVTITQPSCNGSNNGSINLNASGGTPGYTYALGAGTYSATNNFTNLTAGTYTLHVKDNNGCIKDTTVTMGQPAGMAFTLAITNNKCFGDNSGTVTVNATGGTTPYAYAWDANAFQANSLLTGLPAGPHAIHLKDNNGCTKDSTVTLTQPDKVRLAAFVKMPTCEGYKDGVISLSGTGGTAPYTFSKDNVTFNTVVGFANLYEGSYTYYIKDANGCTNDTTIQLIGYPHIIYSSIDVKEPSCFGFKDGIITLNMTGGVPPFTYQVAGLTGAQTDNFFDSLKKGSYTIHIKDSKGCFKDTTITLAQPDKIALKTRVIPNDCEGLDDGGGVEVTVTGGTQPYSYLWTTNPPGTTATIHGMPNGKYLVYVHDAHSCQDSALALVAYDNCCKPFIPDAFTPNGDGRNDIYRVLFKGDMKLIGFSIFNRFGQRVFYTIDTKQGWDGTFNGQLQDMGTYMYYIKAVCGNKGDNIVEFKGDVTLIR